MVGGCVVGISNRETSCAFREVLEVRIGPRVRDKAFCTVRLDEASAFDEWRGRRTNAVARRSEDWNIGLSKDLRETAFAREFLLASIDEGGDLQLALGKVIRAMGVNEFAAKVRMASPNVLRAINPRHNPTQDTLNRLLKPFKLRLSLAPLTGKPRRTAA
jgi:DNA-binding phage protein